MPVAYSADNQSLYHPEQDITLLCDSDWPDEIALAAELSRLAYLRAEKEGAGEKEKLTGILKAAGFGAPELLNDVARDAYGFATCHASGLCVLAFRGTQIDHYQDFLTNIQTLPEYCRYGRVHTGFQKSAQALQPLAENWLKKMTAKRTHLLICGHSLGGAIATLLAMALQPDTLITIGCPRVGDDAFVSSLLGQPQLQVIRVVNCCDAVPTVPPTFLGYEHAGNALYLDCNGKLLHNPTARALKSDRAAGRKIYAPLYEADRLNHVPMRWLADHAPHNYIRAFWP